MFRVAEIARTETREGSTVVDISDIEVNSIWDARHTTASRELQATTPGMDLLVDIGVG